MAQDTQEENKVTPVEITDDEKSGIIELINYVINERVDMEFLSYTELLNLKNKMFD